MCKGSISGCAAINTSDGRFITTNASANLFIVFPDEGGRGAANIKRWQLGNCQSPAEDSQLIYCRVLWETTYGFITPLPASWASVSVCELDVISVHISCIFVRLPSITSS